jgi:hypothetical protein
LLRDKKAAEDGVMLICNKGIGDFSFENQRDMTPLLRAAGIGVQ